jgi:hypothetical protein
MELKSAAYFVRSETFVIVGQTVLPGTGAAGTDEELLAIVALPSVSSSLVL